MEARGDPGGLKYQSSACTLNKSCRGITGTPFPSAFDSAHLDFKIVDIFVRYQQNALYSSNLLVRWT